MSVSCVPCAKRKVRCDRSKPCSHCRRRKGDVCEYPVTIGTSWNSPRQNSLNKMQSEQIERLEQYIRSLGHDPDQLAPRTISHHPTTSNERLVPNDLPAVDNSTPSQNTKRHGEASSRTAMAASRSSEQARLVEHDEQTTYIESPVWYSWSEAKRPANDPLEPSLGRDCLQPLAKLTQAGCNSLLDPMSKEDEVALYKRHPSAQVILALWDRFVSNVHPLTKLFFDWEKGPLLQKAADDPRALSKGEHGFSFAIYFVTILSLSDEDCQAILNDSRRAQLLDDFQLSVETALLAAGFIATSDLLVLQSLLLYLLAMRNRARPATWFSLMGIAVRIAQRMGLHRDGSLLGLPPVQAEEKRRVWWQMQHMEIMISQILGCLSITLHADWDTKLPANLEDSDIRPGTETLPSDRRGLTSMSHCLWRYHILYVQRIPRHPDQPKEDFAWVTSSKVSMAEKEVLLEQTARTLCEKFVQHCELLNPLHVAIQIGIRSFILAMRRVIHQPGVANGKISEMPRGDREDFLKICIESMEYYILGETTPSIAHFRWHTENYFQWTAFVYVIIEAHHRAAAPEASSLWTLINKVCSVHPKLTTAPERPDIVAIGRLIVLAWHQRQEHLQKLHQQVEKPWCVTKMEKELSFFVHGPKVPDTDLCWDKDNFMSLDFDMIDWSAWERDGYAQVLD